MQNTARFWTVHPLQWYCYGERLAHYKTLRALAKRPSSALPPAFCFQLCLITAFATTHYVWQDSPSPEPPYTNWAAAAHVIQDAVDVAQTGDTVLVTNGVYATGGRTVGTGLRVNRVAIDRAIKVQSLMGPEVTIIEGYQLPGTNCGDGAIRCVYLTGGASLSGFTLTHGATRAVDDYPTFRESSGGGVFCESTNTVVSNCVLVGNSAYLHGGGAYDGTLNNCTLAGNSAAQKGGGAYGGTPNNCVVYFNAAPNGANHVDAYLNHCCTIPMSTGGLGNITNTPLFVDYAAGNLRPQSHSPCINAGNNAYVTDPTDLDGNPRIVSGTVDIGAYEYQGIGPLISYAWLQHYGLPTDGSADSLDADLDGHNAWQEWKAWTDPANASSVLKLLPPQPDTNGTLVLWQSVLGRSYSVERATNANAPFSLLQGTIPGQAGTRRIFRLPFAPMPPRTSSA